MRKAARWAPCLMGSVLAIAASLPAEEPPAKPAPKVTKEGDLVPLNMNGTVLLDKAGKRLLLKTHVSLREGALELFCCIKQTKEHESILSLESKAFVMHTGLLALEAKPGAPVRFDPKYSPPQGQRLDIFVNWKDEQGKARREPAQYWVREVTRRFFTEKLDELPAEVKIPEGTELRFDKKLKELSWYGQMTDEQKEQFLALSKQAAWRKAIGSFYDRTRSRQMRSHWVFAGSGFYTDPETGKKFYLAEDGDLICVANFATALVDVSLESSAGNEGLLFEAYTERIPPKDTPVTVELIPVAEKEPAPPKK